jgi:hypothetical protein
MNRMRLRQPLQVLALLAAGLLTACSGGSSSMNAGNGNATAGDGNTGMAMVSLTDAAGDFTSYIVNVDSLQLTRADGTVVETVPVTTQVDFTQLVNLSEILSAAQVPAGRYVKATLTLDYNGATIVVNNGTTEVSVTQILNGANSPATPLVSPNSTVTVNLSLGANNQLIVNPGAVANLALDFNLMASNMIGPSDTAPTTVTVLPTLTASLVPDTAKQIRVRGPLVSTSTPNSDYLINVRPFNNAANMTGQFTVTTTGATSFSINGTSHTGGAGLTELATIPAGTLTVAYGTWDQTSQVFTASSVLVGSSVAGTAKDSVEGTVVARSGDTLTVDDGLLMLAAVPGMSFSRQVTVTVSAGTTVTEDGSTTSAPTIADISVGQHARFSGTLGAGTGGTITLDATAGSAALAVTSLTGTVTGTATGLVTLNLASLDGRPPAAFNFAGTGTTSSQDAVASAYKIEVPAALPMTGVVSGLPARFSGFVAPFGAAPPDFLSETLVNYAQTNAQLLVTWKPPGITAPFATLTSSELLLSQATLQSAGQDALRIGPALLNPSSLSTGLQLVPDATDTSPRFGIAHQKSWSIDSYSTFSDLVTALTTDLNGTTDAQLVYAYGPYNPTTGVLSAGQIVVLLND